MTLYRPVFSIFFLMLINGCASSGLQLINPVKAEKVRASEITVYFNTDDIKAPFERIAVVRGENKSLFHKRNTVTQRQRRLISSVGANALIVEEVRDPGCIVNLDLEICYRFTAVFILAE